MSLIFQRNLFKTATTTALVQKSLFIMKILGFSRRPPKAEIGPLIHHFSPV